MPSQSYSDGLGNMGNLGSNLNSLFCTLQNILSATLLIRSDFALRHQDIGLLSLANILYRSMEYDDALIVINLALEYSPSMVALHFTAGNIYAAKVGVNGGSPLEV